MSLKSIVCVAALSLLTSTATADNYLVGAVATAGALMVNAPQWAG